MLKVTTQHGTYYLIDKETSRAKRVKGDGRNDMYGDSDWFQYHNYQAYDFDSQEFSIGIEVGKGIFFNLINHPQYAWRSSTKVVSIEELDEGENDGND